MAPAGQLVVPVEGKTAADQLVPLAPAVEVKVPAEQMELQAAARVAREAAGREAKKPEDQAAETLAAKVPPVGQQEEKQPAEQPGSAAAADLLAPAVVVERPAAPWVMEATGRLQRTWSTALECLEKEATGLGLQE